MFKYDDSWIWNVNYEKLFWIGILEILIYFGYIVHQYSKLNIKKILNEIMKLILDDHR